MIIFVTFPSKEGYENNAGNIPTGIKAYATNREDRFQTIIKRNNVTTFDMRELFFNGCYDRNPYFATDHHWTPESGFYAYTSIAKKVSEDYGYSINKKSMKISNYNVSTMATDFLGSTGKRTGKIFSGTDDVTKITPKWETKIDFYCDGEQRKGTYEDVFIKKNYLEGKYYEANKYAAYVGGDYALTVQKNKEATNPNAKVLIVEDSFSLVVKPYYSFMFGEVAAIDARRCEANDSIKVAEYVKKEKPELVIVQYTEGVGDMDDDYGNRYDFGL